MDKDDIRSAFPSFTGNFIVSNPVEVKKVGQGEVINLQLHWKQYKKGEGYIGDGSFVNAEFWRNSNAPEDFEQAKKDLVSKSRIHVKNSIPRVDKWETKDGQKRQTFRVKIFTYYPMHLDMELNPYERKENNGNQSNENGSNNDSSRSKTKTESKESSSSGSFI